MKNNYLLISLFFAFVLGMIFFVPSVNTDKTKKYTPRSFNEQKAFASNAGMEYLYKLKANQETHNIDLKDVLASRQSLSKMPQRKSAESSWLFRGPDNIGGRSRAFLVDQDNSHIMYAGGVAGGLWKSTTSGQYWEPVIYESGATEEYANLAISCITQAPNGDIYFGTGEGFAGNHGTDMATPGIYGAGIWKSSNNGQSFEKLESTWGDYTAELSFSIVNEVAADPTNTDVVYAATRKGLKVSKNGGDTWEDILAEDDNLEDRFAGDVAVNSRGDVIASIGNMVYLKKANEDTFLKRSGDISNGLIDNTNIGRLEFAWAPQDPDYVYCAASAFSGKLRNVYQSVNGGDEWVIVGKGGSDLFNPLGTQGIYDLTIAVDGVNKEKIYVGGLDVWAGNAVPSGNLFDWGQISLWALHPSSNLYVHADQHLIVFDPNDPKTFYVASDGGIGRCFVDKEGEDYIFTTLNTNFSVTQFYSVANNGRGNLIGGTQDNGTLLITGEGNTTEYAWEVRGGDGGHVAMSTINPTIAFNTLYYGGLQRNNDAGFADWNEFYASNVIDLHWGVGGYTPDRNQGAFVTPIAYWETDNDPLSTDVAAFVCRRDYNKDTTLILTSNNIFNAPIPVELEKDYLKNDTIYYHDPYASLFALGMARTVWITRSAANFSKGQLTTKDWWRGIPTSIYDNSSAENLEKTTQMQFSADGNHLFVATNRQNLFRISNLKNARDQETADYKFGDPVTTVKKIANFGTRSITGIACDPNNPDNVVVTLGNYGNENYAYLCTMATTAPTRNTSANFINITYNLPKAPAYCALIEQTPNVERVLVGTELGVFMAEGVMSQASSTVTWEPFNNGLQPVPVFQITQQTIGWPWADNKGSIYIGTHGLGFFENRNFYTGVDDEDDPFAEAGGESSINASVYPNPVQDIVAVDFKMKTAGEATIQVLNINGQIIESFPQGYVMNSKKAQINLEHLSEGVYLINIISGTQKATKQIVKQ